LRTRNFAQQPHTLRGNNERAAVTENEKLGQYFILNDGYDTAAKGAIQRKKNPAVFVRISQRICSLKPYREKDFSSAACHLVADLFFVPEAAD
jgi:hypothetical protein